MNRGADGRVHFIEESILCSGIPTGKSPLYDEKNFGA
jgi:hypothetical protein